MTTSPAQLAATLARLPAKQDVSRRSQRAPKVSPMCEEDAAYRAAWGSKGRAPWGRPLRAAFYEFLPESPRGRGLTQDDARRYLAKVCEVIEMQRWSPSERERLRQIQRKWERRAAGKDARFNAIGVQGGINEKHRPKTTGDIIQNIYNLIDTFSGAGARVRPGQRFTVDSKWPLGKPV